MHPDDAQPRTQVMLRPLTSPLPLGFVGLGGGTLALAGQQLGWVPSAQAHLVAVAILVVAVPLQAVTAVLGFLTRDPAVPIAMGVLTATWAMTGLVTLLSPPGSASPVIGLLLFFLAAALVIPAGLALASKGLVTVVLTLAAARFAVTGVYEYVGGSGWMRAAGWVGFALCVVALVAAGVFAAEDARRGPVPATMRGSKRSVFLPNSDGSGTVGPVLREAGVRDQL